MSQTRSAGSERQEQWTIDSLPQLSVVQFSSEPETSDILWDTME